MTERFGDLSTSIGLISWKKSSKVLESLSIIIDLHTSFVIKQYNKIIILLLTIDLIQNNVITKEVKRSFNTILEFYTILSRNFSIYRKIESILSFNINMKSILFYARKLINDVSITSRRTSINVSKNIISKISLLSSDVVIFISALIEGFGIGLTTSLDRVSTFSREFTLELGLSTVRNKILNIQRFFNKIITMALIFNKINSFFREYSLNEALLRKISSKDITKASNKLYINLLKTITRFTDKSGKRKIEIINSYKKIDMFREEYEDYE